VQVDVVPGRDLVKGDDHTVQRDLCVAEDIEDGAGASQLSNVPTDDRDGDLVGGAETTVPERLILAWTGLAAW